MVLVQLSGLVGSLGVFCGFGVGVFFFLIRKFLR